MHFAGAAILVGSLFLTCYADFCYYPSSCRKVTLPSQKGESFLCKHLNIGCKKSIIKETVKYYSCKKKKCCPGFSGNRCTEEMFKSENTAKTFLQSRQKRGLHEECVNEGCSHHEVFEVFENHERAKEYMLRLKCGSCRAGYYCKSTNNNFGSIGSLVASCVEKNECLSNNGGCNHNCTNTDGSFYCNCTVGYTLDADGKSCNDINECLDDNGGCSHDCKNTPGSYECLCDSGLVLNSDDGKTCEDFDECLQENGGCSHFCVNEYRSYHCECMSRFTLASDGKSCNGFGECSYNTRCNSQFCPVKFGSYHCGCPAGYHTSHDAISCINTDECSNTVCTNGGTCIDGIDISFCKCPLGFEGLFCENDVDECKIANGACEEVCNNTVGSYTCQCKFGAAQNRNCASNKPNNASGMSFFDNNRILGHVLPKGCSIFNPTSVLNSSLLYNDIKLSSTDSWYLSSKNDSIYYTNGIVHLDTSGHSLPISISGMELFQSSSGFIFKTGISRYNTDIGYQFGDSIAVDCFNFTSESDTLIKFAGSFQTTYFTELHKLLPNWIKLELADNASPLDQPKISGLKTDIIYGTDLNNIVECNEAPIQNNHTYNVLRIDSEITMTVFNEYLFVKSPLSGQELCIVADITQHNIGTVFILFPPGSRDFLEKLYFFEALKSMGFQFSPKGLGLSLSKNIMVKEAVRELEFWNGEKHFLYSVMPLASAWFSTDIHWNHNEGNIELSFDAKADIYIDLPSISRLLTGWFIDELKVLVQVKDISFSPTLKFKMLGKNVVIVFKDLLTASLDAFLSVGGKDSREWCGDSKNPEGLFLSFFVNVNPFREVPIIKDWEIDLNIRIFGFLSVDSDGSLAFPQYLKEHALKEVEDVKTMAAVLKTEILEFKTQLLNNTETIVVITLDNLINATEEVFLKLENLQNLVNFDYHQVVSLTSDIWDHFRKKVIMVSVELVNVIELQDNKIMSNFSRLVDTKTKNISEKISNLIVKVNREQISDLSQFTGFGIKLSAKIILLGLEFGKAEVEFVYSLDKLEKCSKFKKAYSLLNDEKSAKFLVRFTKKISLVRFISVPLGTTFSLAFSISLDKIVGHLNVRISAFGVVATADMVLSNEYLILEQEIKLWRVFYARVRLEAPIGGNWNSLGFKVHGQLLASKRPNDFSASYLDGILSLITTITDAANKRFDSANNALSKAQESLTTAQSSLTDATRQIERAHETFDNAVSKLGSAKNSLDLAKTALETALDRFRNAQRRVDVLCRLRTCRGPCVPGIRLRWCKSGWFYYPCVSWSRCMFRLPDIPCELANLACRVLRGIAYVALEAAKIFVRGVMIALDTAKLAVIASQHIVDQSRVVLDIAKGALEVAKIGLESAKAIVDTTKIAIEVVRFIVNAALHVYSLIIKYGIQNLIDIKNCQFESQIFILDKTYYQVSCDVNAFSLGWKTFRYEFDFKNPIASMWQTAKATVETLFSIVEQLIGKRKRRDLSYNAMTRLHKVLQIYKRDVSTEFISDGYFNQTYNYSDIYFENEFTNKIVHFAFQCNSSSHILAFLQYTINILSLMTNDSSTAISQASTENINSSLNYNPLNVNTSDVNATLGINTEYAFTEFNITVDDLGNAIKNVSNIKEDPYISDMINTAYVTMEKSETATVNARSMSVMNEWKHAMNNASKSYFEDSLCFGLVDCVLYSFNKLYEIFGDTSISGMESNRNATVNVEDIFLELLSNDTWSIQESFLLASELNEQMSAINESNIWCSKAPSINHDASEKHAVVGSNLTLACTVSGKPYPVIQWYIDGLLLQNETEEYLVLQEINFNHSGKYKCEAENLLSRVASRGIQVDVKECDPGTFFNGRLCDTCSFGYYQQLYNRIDCVSCPTGFTTKYRGAESEDNCIAKEEEDLNIVSIALSATVLVLVVIVFAGLCIFRMIRARKHAKIGNLYAIGNTCKGDYSTKPLYSHRRDLQWKSFDMK